MAQGKEHKSCSKELWIDLIWFLGSTSFNFAVLPVNSCNHIKEWDEKRQFQNAFKEVDDLGIKNPLKIEDMMSVGKWNNLWVFGAYYFQDNYSQSCRQKKYCKKVGW